MKKVFNIIFLILVTLSVSATVFIYSIQPTFNVYMPDDTTLDYQIAKQAIYDDALQCEWAPNNYFLFSENVFSDLIYYSHLFPAIGILLLAGLTYFKGGLTNSIKYLLLLAVAFCLWSLFDLFLWASEKPDLIMLVWSLLILVEFFVFYFLFFLHHYLITDTAPSRRMLLFFSVFLLPIIFFMPSVLNLEGFDYTNCDRAASEGVLWSYLYIYEIITVFLILYTFIKFRTKTKLSASDLQKNSLLTLGSILFLLSFMLGNIVGTFSDDWAIAQYGLLGMPIFLVFIGYVIVRFKAFNIKAIGAQVLVFGLWLLVGSLLLVVQSPTSRAVAFATLLFTLVAGYLLIKSVKREVEQREEIEKLAVNLESANERLKELDKMKSEFVSIASHQLRSPLTSIRGYTSMLVEGSFGVLPEKAKEAVARIGESSRLMSMSVEDYLNVSRIQSGNMKYELSDFNICDLASKIVDDTRREAMKRGLLLTFKNNLKDSKGISHADVGKVNQIIYNLVDNAIKYTPKGRIEVSVTEDKRKKSISIHVTDSGIGMAPNLAEQLFEKFKRAENANAVNVTGTGLGLFIARKMAQDMKGDIVASSPGEGLGSTFTLTLPLHM